MASNERIGAQDLSYPERFATFEGYWDEHEATARQLAVIGHVYDRPPLEALVEGSRCVTCSAFVRKELSTVMLEGPLGEDRPWTQLSSYNFEDVRFHLEDCPRRQIRFPMETQRGMWRNMRQGDASRGSPHAKVDVKPREGAIEAPIWLEDPSKMVRPQGHRDSQGEVPIQPEPKETLQAQTVASCEEHPTRTNFFSLPLELRQEIYRLVLPTMPDEIMIVPESKYLTRVTRAPNGQTVTSAFGSLMQLGLLETCKTIHVEGMSLLFNLHIFRFSPTHVDVGKVSASASLYLFLRSIGARGRRLLRNVDIQLGAREDAIALALLASCSRLRTIIIRHPRPHLMQPFAPLWRVEGIASLIALRGLETVQFRRCKEREERQWLRMTDADGAIIMKELTRSRGEVGGIRHLGGRWLDI